MTKVSGTPRLLCPTCGAGCYRFAGQCWLCGADLSSAGKSGAGEIVTASLVTRPPHYAPSEWFFAGLSGLVALVLLVVAVGAALTEPALGVGFLILVLPPVAVTVLRLYLKQRAQQPVTWAERFLTFLLSLLCMFLLVGTLAVVGFIAFFVYCLTQAGRGSWQ